MEVKGNHTYFKGNAGNFTGVSETVWSEGFPDLVMWEIEMVEGSHKGEKKLVRLEGPGRCYAIHQGPAPRPRVWSRFCENTHRKSGNWVMEHGLTLCAIQDPEGTIAQELPRITGVPGPLFSGADGREYAYFDHGTNPNAR